MLCYKSFIMSLWEKGFLPIKNALYFSDDSAFSLLIDSYPNPLITKGDRFSFAEFDKTNDDEVTEVDVFREIKLSSGKYCCCGGGGYGSDGFIAGLNVDKTLMWVIFSDSSNPFIGIEEIGVDVVLVESSLGFNIKIDINNPYGMTLS